MCIWAHDPNNQDGENLAYSAGSGTTADAALAAATVNWYNEISKYNWAAPSFSGTGHFTQVRTRACSPFTLAGLA